MALLKRNIACLESLWDNRTDNRLSVIPMLEIISKNWNVKFSHLICNTEEELRYDLHLLCKRNYGILYLAFHGSPGNIHLHGDNISLSDLAKMMDCKFKDWIIHFGSCSTLRKRREVFEFVEKTKVKLVTGFTRQVYWIESTAFELMLFENFLHFKNPKIACRNLLEKHPSFAEATGFKIFPEII